MEYALWGAAEPTHRSAISVLILILMEYALWDHSIMSDEIEKEKS